MTAWLRAAAAALVGTAWLTSPCRPDLPPSDRSGFMVEAIIENLDSRSDEWFHEGDYLRCAAAFRVHIAYEPRDLEPYFLSAWLLWSDGRDAEAQEMFQAAVRAAPDSYEPYLEAGLHWSGRRDERRAALWLTHACVRGGPVEAWKTLSHCYRKLGLIEDAIAAMRHARTMDPDDPTIPQNLRWLDGMRDPSSRTPRS